MSATRKPTFRKAKALLGYEPLVSFEDGLERTRVVPHRKILVTFLPPPACTQANRALLNTAAHLGVARFESVVRLPILLDSNLRCRFAPWSFLYELHSVRSDLAS